eukprot:TRINITY_DN9330_c0_g1_i1.p1 TRINITY_DN9330_c0_g1~~TRINITY_DN9330_c0_g1_i1.p1  ORF type:complete len:237 (+),score=23.63 TRINITY_DN9330_c0_g1_i1:452-1162(+)
MRFVVALNCISTRFVFVTQYDGKPNIIFGLKTGIWIFGLACEILAVQSVQSLSFVLLAQGHPNMAFSSSSVFVAMVAVVVLVLSSSSLCVDAYWRSETYYNDPLCKSAVGKTDNSYVEKCSSGKGCYTITHNVLYGKASCSDDLPSQPQGATRFMRFERDSKCDKSKAEEAIDYTLNTCIADEFGNFRYACQQGDSVVSRQVWPVYNGTALCRGPAFGSHSFEADNCYSDYMMWQC